MDLIANRTSQLEFGNDIPNSPWLSRLHGCANGRGSQAEHEGKGCQWFGQRVLAPRHNSSRG